MAQVADQGLVPLLPDDVALQCLLRVPVRSLSRMKSVSRRWRDLVNSPEFYQYRKREGTTGRSVCLLQAMGASDPHPLFSVSLFHEKHSSWERLPPIPDYESGGLPVFSRFAAVGGLLVVLGGWSPSTMAELRSVHVFSFSSWSWRRGADMPTTRSFFSCSVLDDTIIVAGGHDVNKNALPSADRYHLDDDRWETLPHMCHPRDECASVVLDDHKLVVLSGYGTSTQGEFRDDAEVFDPYTNTWTVVHNMWPKGVSPSCAVAVAGKLFAFLHSKLMAYDWKSGWRVVDDVPDDERGISAAVCATAFGTSIVVTGPSNMEDGSHRVLVYKLAEDTRVCNGRWETVPVDERFRGIAHVSCVVEV